MEITNRKVSDLIPYDKNPRKNDEAVKYVKASIEQFGFKVPIVIDAQGVIVAGHTRLKAAKELGMKEVPCIVADDLNEEQIKAFRLADNMTASKSEWDFELLQGEIDMLADFDLTQFGFDEAAVIDDEQVFDDNFDTAGALGEIETPITKRGDVWRLGPHRLMCGDSTSSDDIKVLMDGDLSKLLFTSPPYSDMREYNGGKDLDVCNLKSFITKYKDCCAIQAVNLGIQRKDKAIIRYWDEYIKEAEDAGLKLLAWNVWDKLMAGSIGNQSAMIPIRHEWIFVFGADVVDINKTWQKKQGSINADGTMPMAIRQKDGSITKSTKGVTSGRFKPMESVIKYEAEGLESVTEGFAELGDIRNEHPATFPVFLPAEYIMAFTDRDDVVVEPFGGSGTTLIACQELGRKCHCMELDEKYCDVIIKRWEALTGDKAVLNG